MATESLVVGIARDGRTERVPVRGDRTEWTREDTLLVYDDGTQVGEFPAAQYVIRAANLEE
jgi:hypothetical protein